MAKGKNLKFDRSEYDQILNDVLEHAEQGDEPVEVEEEVEYEREESWTPETSEWKAKSQHTLAKVMLALCVMSIGWYGFSAGGSDRNALTKIEAEQQLQQVYGSEYNTVSELNTFISDQEQSFDSGLRLLNETLSDETDDRPQFLKEYFYLFGDTLVYTEPRSTPQTMELGNEQQ